MHRQTALAEQLQLASFALELLVRGGDTALLPVAADEVSRLAERLAASELARAVAAGEVAEQTGLAGADPSLKELAAAMGGERGEALRGAGAHLRAAVAQLSPPAQAATLAQQRLDRLHTSLDRLQEGGAPAAAYPGVVSPAVPPLRFDGGA